MNGTDSRVDITECLLAGRPVVIASHRRPDGDALGSSLGLLDWLEARGVRAVVVGADGVPEPYGFLQRAGEVRDEVPADISDFTLAVLDTPSPARAAVPAHVFRRASCVIDVDHHPDNALFGDINLVDVSASSVALLIYELIRSAGGTPRPSGAEALYTGVMTDTGCFRFGNTDARTLEAAAALVRLGAGPAALANSVYGEQPVGRLHLLGKVLESIEIAAGGRVAVSALTREMKEQTGCTGDEIEGVASFGRLVRGVEVAVLLREENGRVRASLRSRGGVDVGAVARSLGGGGHSSAAGVVLAGSLEDARSTVLGAVERSLRGEDA